MSHHFSPSPQIRVGASKLRSAAIVVVALALMASACSSSSDSDAGASPNEAPTDVADENAITVAPGQAREFPPAPEVSDGPLHPDDQATIETIIGTLDVGFDDLLPQLVDQSDARTLWILADLLRWVQGTQTGETVRITAETIAGTTINPDRPWRDLTDHLIAWDLPAPPDYEVFKAALFTAVDDRWQFVFSDPEADIDYRMIHWGGAFIDDRTLGEPEGCDRGCIPSLDDPSLTDADEGGWYPDDAIVFGIEVQDEAVAFPRNIMEVHEMVNITIGGRRLGIPYCTLCGSAQAFFTDDVVGTDRPPVLRTSGLLSRSNKVMYDLDSQSVFDTFTGDAVSGPLRELGVTLPQTTIVTTTWLDWRTNHPDTSIVAEDGGIGRTYELDPLDGRDDNGPIFPIGVVDERLGVHEPVLGVAVTDGFVAFPVEATRATLLNGDAVTAGGVTVELDGQGLRATLDGEPIATHQAFWFAWSQFHPDTDLWLPEA
jgi:hypothetical protein